EEVLGVFVFNEGVGEGGLRVDEVNEVIEKGWLGRDNEMEVREREVKVDKGGFVGWEWEWGWMPWGLLIWWEKSACRGLCSW
ncbi:hypothetical protein, partial [Neisseria sicca]|uniref:hypothetical protein n=1 Tax=Neisseria sicca TaxID=490 RepID=UPI001C99A83E